MKKILSYITFTLLMIVGFIYVGYLVVYVYYDEPKQLDWIGWVLFLSILAIIFKLISEWLINLAKRVYDWLKQIYNWIKRKDK